MVRVVEKIGVAEVDGVVEVVEVVKVSGVHWDG